MTPIRVTIALVLVMAAVLLAAGCAVDDQGSVKKSTSNNMTVLHPTTATLLPTHTLGLRPTTPEEYHEIPAGNYIFLEHKIRIQGTTLGGDCSPVAYTGGPTFLFDEQKGTLSTATVSSDRINESLLLLYVIGESETSSARTGGGGSVYPVYTLPVTMWDNLTLISSTPEGIVTMDYQNTSITLKPKERWSINTTPIIRNGCPGSNPLKNCTEEIVITDSIYNAGLFDKQKIKAH